MNRVVPIALAALAFAALASVLYVRMAPMRPADWHRDPTEADRTGRPNDYLVGPAGDREAVVVDELPEALLARLDAVALAEPRTTRLAGSPAEGWVSYLQRSVVVGFPDVVNVRADPEGSGSQLVVWSRSRFGQSDFGVNKARVDRWLAMLGVT